MSPAVFWTIATVMAVLAAAAVAIPMFWLRRADGSEFGPRRVIAAASLAAAVPLCALGIYAVIGSPALVVDARVGAGASPLLASSGTDSAPTPGGSGAKGAGDLREATARLESRLATQPDDPAGWELLAQSYEFAGRPQDAAAARQRRLPAGAGTVAAAAATPAAGVTGTVGAGLDPAAVASIAARLPGSSDSSDALVQRAQQARRDRNYPAALAAFERLVLRNAMDADLWADYADATAGARGGLDEVSEALIAKALALEPRHTKGLWLLGSLQVTRRDFAAALATWQQLQRVLPPESSDARLIGENIVEARAALAAAAPSGQPTPAPAAAIRVNAAVAIRGEVQLDPRWREQVSAQTVLYIFAKAVGQAGPPVAVLRTSVARWPYDFVLDDSLAMLPDRKLSGASSVIVEARLSQSGSANPQPGDLRGVSAALDPRKTGPLRILIAEKIS